MKRLLSIIIFCVVIAWSMSSLAADGYGVSVYGTNVYGAAGGARPKVLISGNNGLYTYLLVDATDPAYDTAVQVDGTGNVFENCTFYSSVGVALLVNEHCTVTNCILEGNTQDIDIADAKIVTAKNNSLHHSTDAANNIGAGTYDDTDSIFAFDPLFRDKAGQDFRITSVSPLKDVGYNTGEDIDLGGRMVPAGAGYDIGAYEYYGYTWRRSIKAGICGSILGGIN